jgi:hypothetical protein
VPGWRETKVPEWQAPQLSDNDKNDVAKSGNWQSMKSTNTAYKTSKVGQLTIHQKRNQSSQSWQSRTIGNP